MKKIILVNFLIIIILFFIVEFISYVYIYNDAKSYFESYNKYAKQAGLEPLTIGYKPVSEFNQNEFINNYARKINTGNNKKPSVLFMGCSYMWGSSEEEEHTIPYIINKKTNRTTINRAIPGGSILNSLYDLSNEDFYNLMSNYPKPDYIIFLYINDHLNRISIPYRGTVVGKYCKDYEINPYIKFEKGKIYIKHRPKVLMQLYGLYMVKAFNYFYSQKFQWESNEDKMFKLFKAAKDITDEKFPNSKFVIIDYKDGGHLLMGDTLKNSLEKEGFIILNAEKLAGHELDSDKYRAQDKEHPSYDAFKDVSAGLIKTLGLQ